MKQHTFKFRTGDTDEKGGCTFIGGSWVDKTTDELFKGKKIVLFSLPGAFTPTCSGEELPSYDRMYQDFNGANLNGQWNFKLEDYIPPPAERSQLPQQPQPNPAIIQPQTVMTTGLTPAERTLLSEEEKMIRLRNRGLA